MYPLFDPPVTPFSAPSDIRSWIRELEDLAGKPEFASPAAKRELDHTLAEAREWLQTSLSVHDDRGHTSRNRASG